MDGANPPTLVRARQDRQLCPYTTDWPSLKGPGDLRSRDHPCNVADECHLDWTSLGGDSGCKADIRRQMMRPVLGARLDAPGFQDDCIVCQQRESGSGVATCERIVELAHCLTNRDGVGREHLGLGYPGRSTEGTDTEGEDCR
jgi:hypothetical protein